MVDSHKLLDEIQSSFFAKQELAPGIHRRALPVFEWWQKEYPRINDAGGWFVVDTRSDDQAEVIQGEIWKADLFDHVVPMGLLQARSIVELSYNLRDIRLILDWSRTTWMAATAEVFLREKLYPSDWPPLSEVNATVTHFAVSQTSILGAMSYKLFRQSESVESAVRQMVAEPLDIGWKNHIRHAESGGKRFFGVSNLKLVMPSADWPVITPPFYLHGLAQSKATVTAERLAAHAGCVSRTIRDKLKGITPMVEAIGQNGGHQWRYSDAITELRKVETGKLKGVVWPDSVAELRD